MLQYQKSNSTPVTHWQPQGIQMPNYSPFSKSINSHVPTLISIHPAYFPRIQLHRLFLSFSIRLISSTSFILASSFRLRASALIASSCSIPSRPAPALTAAVVRTLSRSCNKPCCRSDCRCKSNVPPSCSLSLLAFDLAEPTATVE